MSGRSYYNEHDPYAAQWLRNLIAAGHVAAGDVDERSIVDIRPSELRGYTQAHFFAGIGGWSIALRLAGWPDDRPVWTGSCPCQPFSAAGQGAAFSDARHLWPTWFSLIRELAPAAVFGEQVEAAVGWGWLDAVFADLEEQGYACGASVLPACGVGAPHIRQRLWFVAYANGRDAGAEGIQRGGVDGQQPQDGGLGTMADTAGCGVGSGPCNSEPGSIGIGIAADSGGMVDAAREQVGVPRRSRQPGETHWTGAEWINCTDGKARPIRPGSSVLAHGIRNRASKLRAYGNAIVPQVAAEFIRAAMQ